MARRPEAAREARAGRAASQRRTSVTDDQTIIALTAACTILALLFLRASFIAAIRGARLKRMLRELE
jgi:hypothetical protein